MEMCNARVGSLVGFVRASPLLSKPRMRDRAISVTTVCHIFHDPYQRGVCSYRGVGHLNPDGAVSANSDQGCQ